MKNTLFTFTLFGKRMKHDPNSEGFLALTQAYTIFKNNHGGEVESGGTTL